MKIITLLSLFGSSHAHITPSNPFEQHWHIHPTSLPSPVSDLSATLDPNTGKVYLIGGCNSTDGNIFIPDGYFICPDVTNYANIFDAKTGRIEKMPDAPHKRYRHAAVFHDGLVWVLGGRDVMDNMVTEVDIFDVASNKWREDLSFSLPDEFVKSDHTAFVIDQVIYMVGGYEPAYTATATNLAIDIPLSLESKTDLSYSQKNEMNEACGDCHATVVNGVGYVVGGFTHLDNFERTLGTVESYRPFEDVWKDKDDLTYGRADMAVVAIGNKIYVVGGEARTDASGNLVQRTNITTEVEVLDTSNPDALWSKEIADLPDDHFRFPAVSYDSIIYTFGGQAFYSDACKCFATKSTILTFDTMPPTPAPTTMAPTIAIAPNTTSPTTIAMAPNTTAPTIAMALNTTSPTTIAMAPNTTAPTIAMAPNTTAPTTIAPTTMAPVTMNPTIVAPTTTPPTTIAPPTLAPVTLSPTTLAPIAMSIEQQPPEVGSSRSGGSTKSGVLIGLILACVIARL